jgi:hypothetical protein
MLQWAFGLVLAATGMVASGIMGIGQAIGLVTTSSITITASTMAKIITGEVITVGENTMEVVVTMAVVTAEVTEADIDDSEDRSA